MQNIMKHILYMAAYFCFAFAAQTSPAMADCADPAGKKGEIAYNSDYQAFQGCDGSNWVAFHDPQCAAGDGCTVDPCETGPIGTMCNSDNAIYAGTTVGGARMYAAPCDHGQSWDGASCTGSRIAREWKTTLTATADTDSTTDGVANTDAIALAGLAAHPAAEACRNIGAEWYLPAQDELDTLYTNLADTGVTPSDSFNFTITGGYTDSYYWSSTEDSNPNAWSQSLENAYQYNDNKTVNVYVRCVRR